MHSPEPNTNTSSCGLLLHSPLSQHLELDHKPSGTSSDPQQSVWYMKHPRDSAAGAVSLSLALSLGMAAERGSKKARRAAGGGDGDGGGEFVCKTCSRAFGSFQALGGHRTSHLRGRHGLALGMPAPAKDAKETATKPAAAAAAAPASHLCHVCGLGFEMGQALGGHMRRHREEAAATTAQAPPVLLQLFV